MRNIVTELCLPNLMYYKNLWQSINKTNQESKYLQFLQVRNLLSIQSTLLTICFIHLAC